MVKTCNRCGEYKERSAFFRNRKGKYGLMSYCKPCFTARQKERLVEQYGSVKIRGLLCNKCNTGIGRLGDSIEYVRRFLTYLESRHG